VHLTQTQVQGKHSDVRGFDVYLQIINTAHNSDVFVTVIE